MSEPNKLLSLEGLLTLAFTETVAMVIFHGTDVGHIIMGALGFSPHID